MGGLIKTSANMDPARLQRILGSMQQGGAGAAAVDTPIMDTAETIYISSLSLLKMLKHGRAGVPMEVMGLMLGEFVDEYTIVVKDVFAMPQSGTGVTFVLMRTAPFRESRTVDR